MLRVVDLFCGGGGSTTGVEMSGVASVVAGMDNDAKVLEIYRNNHKHLCWNRDISNIAQVVKEIRKLRPDVLVGSPPCQDFSLANSNRQEGARANLTRTFAEIVCGLNVNAFVMENVPEMLTSDAFVDARELWKQAGYHIAAVLITACHVGAPQRRRRAIVIGTRGSCTALKTFIEKVHHLLGVEPMTVRQALPRLGETYIVIGRNRKAAWVRSSDRPAPTLRRNCLVAPNANNYRPREDDAGPLNLAHLLTAQQAGVVSGFPAEYKWGANRMTASHVIGNAVCPPVMSWIFKNALDALKCNIPREEGEEPLYLESHPAVHGPYPGAPRSLCMLGLARTPDVPDADFLQSVASRIPGLWIYRTSPTLVVRYRMGEGDKDADLRAQAVARCPMKPGWVLESRQRGVQNSQSDDLYWFIPDAVTPGKMLFYRSKLNIYRAGHFAGLDVDIYDEND